MKTAYELFLGRSLLQDCLCPFRLRLRITRGRASAATK